MTHFCDNMNIVKHGHKKFAMIFPGKYLTLRNSPSLEIFKVCFGRKLLCQRWMMLSGQLYMSLKPDLIYYRSKFHVNCVHYQTKVFQKVKDLFVNDCYWDVWIACIWYSNIPRCKVEVDVQSVKMYKLNFNCTNY